MASPPSSCEAAIDESIAKPPRSIIALFARDFKCVVAFFFEGFGAFRVFMGFGTCSLSLLTFR